ncbi:MAG: NAD(+)/NADH kinase [Pseudomonadota bacterium]
MVDAGAFGRVAICVNPMSGRDVRRLAARATNMTHEAKRDLVARIAAGAQATGATDLYVTREPYNIAALALELMPLTARVHVLDVPLKNDASDTERAVAAFLAEGVRCLVSLGGDGTNRAIVRALGERCDEVCLLPLSTGTNNVYPVLAEPTIVGMAAGLQARDRLTAPQLRSRSKVLRVRGTCGHGRKVDDLGLIDAVLLRDDHVGNLLPFDTQRIAQILLTRAEATGIGMSPIGGLIQEVREAEDEGLLVTLDAENESADVRRFLAPVSPGLFAPVAVRSTRRLPLGTPVLFHGPGVLALDGDRDFKLPERGALTVTIERSGPPVLDAAAALRWAAAQAMMPAELATQLP